MANRIGRAMKQIKTLDALANADRWINRIHPLVKFTITILYIVLTVAFGKYNLEGLIGMSIYPIIMFVIADLSFKDCLKRLRIVLPVVCVVGAFNPFFDHTIVTEVGGVAISGGVISMITLMLKGVFTVLASYLLIATTSIESLCFGLRLLHLPKIFVTQILLIYRYITVLLEEANKITQAYALRAPGQKGVTFHVWGPLLGQLLIRTMDRAKDLYESMELRGFTGEFKNSKHVSFGIKDVLYLTLWVAVLVVFFIFPVFSYAGNLLG